MIVKVPNYIENYRAVARYAKGVDRLSGHGDLRKIEPAARQLLEDLALEPNETLVDVGCGSGAFLRLVKPLGIEAIGTAATEEEARRLEETGIKVVAGLSDSLPLPDGMASLLVANGVLLLVAPERILPTLREFQRVTKPGGRIWVGSNAWSLENQDVPPYKSTGDMLWFLLRKRGLRTFLGMCRRILIAQVTREPIVLNQTPHSIFYGPAEDFIAMAESIGLELIRQQQDGNRYSCMFRRP